MQLPFRFSSKGATALSQSKKFVLRFYSEYGKTTKPLKYNSLDRNY